MRTISPSPPSSACATGSAAGLPRAALPGIEPCGRPGDPGDRIWGRKYRRRSGPFPGSPQEGRHIAAQYFPALSEGQSGRFRLNLGGHAPKRPGGRFPRRGRPFRPLNWDGARYTRFLPPAQPAAGWASVAHARDARLLLQLLLDELVNGLAAPPPFAGKSRNVVFR
jgi:hypothetical protein